MKKACLVIFMLLLLVAGQSCAAEIWTATVTEVVDGDTLLVKRASKPECIRLAGIDAPESDQSGGPRACYLARDMAKVGDTVQVRALARDKYGRIIAWVSTADGRDMSRTLVTLGAAWAECKELRPVQKRAQDAHIGIWAVPDPIHPRHWRKGDRAKAGIK
jgi:endonuclease YncB( thermonuclease family)